MYIYIVKDYFLVKIQKPFLPLSYTLGVAFIDTTLKPIRTRHEINMFGLDLKGQVDSVQSLKYNSSHSTGILLHGYNSRGFSYNKLSSVNLRRHC